MFKKETYVDVKNNYKQDEFGRDTTQPHLYKHTLNVYDGTNDIQCWFDLDFDTPITNANIETYVSVLNGIYGGYYHIYYNYNNNSLYVDDSEYEYGDTTLLLGGQEFTLSSLVIHDDVRKVF